MKPEIGGIVMLTVWDGIVGSVTILCIVAMAFGIMLQFIELSEGIRRIGVILGCALLLVILPAIILGIWSHLSIWRKLGVSLVIAIVVIFLVGLRKRPHRARARSHSS